MFRSKLVLFQSLPLYSTISGKAVAYHCGARGLHSKGRLEPYSQTYKRPSLLWHGIKYGRNRFHPSLIFCDKAGAVACTRFTIVTYDCNDSSLYY